MWSKCWWRQRGKERRKWGRVNQNDRLWKVYRNLLCYKLSKKKIIFKKEIWIEVCYIINNTALRSYRLLNKNSNARRGYFSMKCWSQTLQRAPKAKSIAMAFIGTPELDGETLLLKSPHTSVTGYIAIKSEPSWKLTSSSSARRSYANQWGEKSHQRSHTAVNLVWYRPALPREMCPLLQQWDDWHGVTNPFPAEFQAHSLWGISFLTVKQTNKNKQTLPKVHGLGSQRH